MGVALDGFVESEDAVGGLLIVRDGGDGEANGVKIGERVTLSAYLELDVGRHERGIGQVDSGLDRLIDAIIACVANHADDLAPIRTLRGDGVRREAGDETRHANLTAERIGLGRVAFDECLIDDGDEVAASVFRSIPDAAVKQGNAESGEIFGTDELDVSLRLLPVQVVRDVEGLLAASCRAA